MQEFPKIALGGMFFLTSCSTTDDVLNDVPRGWGDALGRTTQFLCGFVPAAADVGVLFEVTGAAKVKQASTIVCNAVEKRKAELLAARAKKPREQGVLEAGGADRLPIGTTISIAVAGKTIQGLTTR